MRRDISRTGLLFVAVGAIVGSGWLLAALPAAQMAGPAAIIAWIVGAVMIGLIGLVYAELGTMFPLSGAVVRFPLFTHGTLTGYNVGWISWVVAVSLGPVEVEAVLQYAANYLPFLIVVKAGTPVLTGAGYGVAVGLLLVFSFINIVGVRLFSRVNAVVVWWKLAVIILVVVLFLALAFHPKHFTGFGGFAPYGATGIFTAVATGGIAFSFFGFRQGIELAGEADRPQRSVPLTILGSLAISTLLYVLVQTAFIGAAPTSGLAHGGWAHLNFSNSLGPMAGIAQIIGLFWLAGILYADAIVSPADTGLVYTTVTARISYAMGRSATAPRALARVSSRGVPWVSVIITFAVGLLIFLPFPGWQKLAAFLTAANVVSFGSGPVSLLALRRSMPDAKRPFKLPAAPVLAFLAFYATGLLVFWVGWSTDWKMFVTLLIGFAIYAIYRATQPAPRPPLHWRNFSWMAGWLAGLAIISALGSYGGGAGVISSDLAFGVLAVFSALVLWWGVATRLPDDRIRSQLASYGRDDNA
jgi:amino acid transporter